MTSFRPPEKENSSFKAAEGGAQTRHCQVLFFGPCHHFCIAGSESLNSSQKTELQISLEHPEKQGLRDTPERKRIVREVFAANEHFGVDSLYLHIRRKGLHVSKASTRRLLPLLTEAGLIQQVFFEDGHMSYEHILGCGHHCRLR